MIAKHYCSLEILLGCPDLPTWLMPHDQQRKCPTGCMQDMHFAIAAGMAESVRRAGRVVHAKHYTCTTLSQVLW